ncbi:MULTISPECIES: PEP/pyruvate-binding domain-containing protein [Micrococcales]|uniref:PEP/pyruvate-binding domain-containing protein n=1 Tax=Micrococcales TaxID=85006 RepID=UPI00083913FF|nr:MULTISPECIES: PEP/pyruvate-binding domain-containing protein [Micrococcales]
MLTTLSEATRTDAGGKAATLGALLRAGLPVPDGFVLPSGIQQTGTEVECALRDAVARGLERMGDPVVAVRSSATNEDSAEASAAGQYESVIGVRGAEDVCQAIATCWASARATRVGDYWARSGDGSPQASGMSVLVQPVIEADVSGVMFTPQRAGGPTRIEACWGLGLPVVGGTVGPDAYEVAPDGIVGFSAGSKQTRVDLDHERGGVVTSAVTPGKQSARTLDDTAVTALADLGGRIAAALGGPQDVEWAVADGTVWILQARPITAALPARNVRDLSDQAGVLSGTPGSHGTVTAAARVVLGPSDFSTVRAGDIVVCPYTDPAWTPLFTVAAGVVTETGGALSHAAIIAREYGIPAVLGIDGATTHIENGDRITLDGAAGTVTVL